MIWSIKLAYLVLLMRRISVWDSRVIKPQKSRLNDSAMPQMGEYLEQKCHCDNPTISSAQNGRQIF